MRTWWFLVLAFVTASAATGCQKTAENSGERNSDSRLGSRTQRERDLDYDSYSRQRNQRRLQEIEDAEDAAQDDSMDDDYASSRTRQTTRRPATGRSDRLSGLEDEEPEEAMLDADRSDRPTREDYFNLGSAGRLDEQSLDEDHRASDILADEEDDPRRR